MQIGMAKDFGELVNLAIQRGYKNPQAWAKFILRGRQQKKYAK